MDKLAYYLMLFVGAFILLVGIIIAIAALLALYANFGWIGPLMAVFIIGVIVAIPGNKNERMP